MLSKKEENVLALISQDTSLSNYFFQRAKDLKWFYPLKEKGFFLPEKIPLSESGGFLFWNILDYLERSSEQVTQNPQYGKDLIGILDNLYQFAKNKNKINNLHIWWYCSKILFNIPFEIIKENLSAQQFRSWLSLWADYSDLVISDISGKLLLKFLKEDGAVEYVESIVDVLTEIRAVEKPTVIGNLKNALLARDNYWVLQAFEQNSRIRQICSSDTIFGIADKLKKVIEYQQQIQYDITQIGDKVYRIEVSRVAIEGIRSGEIGFQEGVFNCKVKQFSQDQIKGISTQDLWTLHDKMPEISTSEEFRITARSKAEFLFNIMNGLPKEIEWELVDNIHVKIELLFTRLHSDYTYIFIKSMLNIDANLINTAESVLTVILRDILIVKCKEYPEEVKQVLEKFLSYKYPFPVFRRFVLLCIDISWTTFATYFDKFLELIPSAFEESAYEVELHDILLHHSSNFAQYMTDGIKELIRKIPTYYIEKGEKLSSYWQFKWLSPLKNNIVFSPWYEEIKQKVQPEEDKPYEPERSAIRGGIVVPKSPITTAEILSSPIPEFVTYLNNFKGPDRFNGIFEGKPDKEGLASAFHAAVIESPKKYTDEIDAFIDVEDLYLIELFRGLREVWKAEKEKDIDWERIFNFILKYIERGNLKNNQQGVGKDSYSSRKNWIIKEIVDLISEGSSNDAHSFSPGYFEKVNEIFNGIIPLLKGEDPADINGDALMYALNSTHGRFIMAYLTFALRVARVRKEIGDIKEDGWGKNKYEQFFHIGIDAYIWFGAYLPQIKYLDDKYAKEKIESFNEMDATDFKWQMFIEGYLRGGNVYEDLYKLMRSNCLKAMKKDFGKEVNRRLVDYICLGYLHFDELLQPKNEDGQDSLFWKMLMDEGSVDKKDRWLNVAGFFWSRSAPENRFVPKIVDFWKWTFNENAKIKITLGEDYNLFLSKMATLIFVFDKIDEEKVKWLLLCAPYIEMHGNATFIIEYLTKYEDPESVRNIGVFFKKVLETGTPSYKQEDIQLIIRRIYEKGGRNVADEICNTYGRRGVHFLKQLWEEFQTIKCA